MKQKRVSILFLILLGMSYSLTPHTALSAIKPKTTALLSKKPTVHLFLTSHSNGPNYLYKAVQKMLNPKMVVKENSNRLGQRFPGIDEEYLSIRLALDALETLKKKGYRCDYHINSDAKTFFSTLEDPNTFGIFHEGHARVGNINSDYESARIVIDEEKFTQTTIDEKRLNQYLNLTHHKTIRPSSQLHFIRTHACFGGLCEPFYRKLLSLPEPVEWVGASIGVGSWTAYEMFQGFQEFVESLPNAPDTCDRLLSAKK